VIACAKQSILLLLTALCHFQVQNYFIERLRRSRFVPIQIREILYFVPMYDGRKEIFMKIKLNREQVMDKIYACWLGKNIGGTMGAPYEGKQEMQDINGFATKKGEPLPNDDLDLQLIWLTAMEETGPHALSANVLADYWLMYIPPHWNEYGVGKNNAQHGIIPPMSGEFCNEEWKHSNGAWIRSEVWACMTPGFPNIAVKYALMDACVDHGISEGTYAEMFTASLESLAFFESDIRTLVENALTYIPKNCRVARSVNLVLSEYDKKTPWREVRELIVKDNEDLGWFQAPANVAYTVLGLIYGEGDFKKSMIYAIDCGDDTDCTGATCGAILGITQGTKGIPEDWREYIGDRIISLAVDRGSIWNLPNSCTEMTERVAQMIPSVLKANGVYMEFTDGETEYNEEEALAILKDISDDFIHRCPNSFEIRNLHVQAVLECPDGITVRANEDFKFRIVFKNLKYRPKHLQLSAFLPEGWTADYSRMVYLSHVTPNTDGRTVAEFVVHVGEKVDAMNRIYIHADSVNYTAPLTLPLVVVG